ncbi:hypothetical protein [Verrucomicrobium sp. BvORR106]|uniref:hypothetical protein n=1 Tax=Verrucomicrobium sp. BvORR106 TaxID=1403819 RepID=UPI00056DECFA|nr:hypothetical protein [Verrucomicrobium sp. BvORR106]
MAAGRKPAFHEYLGDEAAPLAQALGREFPGLHVEAFDGHLVVADLDLVGTIAGTADPAAASAALREAALSDNIGEYLGYGVPHWNEADAIVTLRDASGEMLAGFHTLNEGVEDFARDRAQDYAAYLGPGVTAEIELKRKPQPQSQPKSQPQGQSGDQGQSQDQVPSASQGLSGAPSQAGDPQGAAPAPAGTGNTGLAAPASRERAAQYFEQAFAASSALFQHLGLGIEEIHTEAEAAARGIPAHISVGVSRDGRRLVVVRPRLEPGTTAALAAAITREELIHAAWIAALREQWRRDPQGRTFQDHLRHKEGRILEELELTEAGREALLNTVNIYHGQGRTQTGPLYTSYDQARAAVDGGLSGMVTELARQLIQMREGGRLSEHVFARTMRRLRDWMRKALRGLKKLAARPENASPLLNQAIRDTEAILEGRDISPLALGCRGHGVLRSPLLGGWPTARHAAPGGAGDCARHGRALHPHRGGRAWFPGPGGAGCRAGAACGPHWRTAHGAHCCGGAGRGAAGRAAQGLCRHGPFEAQPGGETGAGGSPAAADCRVWTSNPALQRARAHAVSGGGAARAGGGVVASYSLRGGGASGEWAGGDGEGGCGTFV